ncbi:hypothetical protein BDR03DRAFT_984642 [Suillus americanus]|nr:hypothetical protein BDR03DRAFT_984642 [Suillus americanus]
MVSIEDNDSVSEYRDSDHDSEKLDDNMEVPEDDNLDLLSQEELIKEIPHFIPPRTARSASAQTRNVSKLWSSSSSTQMASSGVSDVADESNSEMQFADKDCEESDTQAGQCSKSHYLEPSSTVTNLKPQPGKKKRSKLAEARQQLERPRFAEPKDEAPPTSKLDDKDSSEHPFAWPEFTDLIYSADGSINLKAQNTQIQKMALKAVHNAAGKHKEYAILKRVKHNFDYAVALAGVLEGQLSSFHTNLKKLAHQIMVSHFVLKKGCAEEVEGLIKSHKYIFPTDAKGKALGDQPFCDESMIDTIQLSFFDGEDSIGVQSHEDFVSVLDGNEELELPVAMVCLIATLICSILKD